MTAIASAPGIARPRMGASSALALVGFIVLCQLAGASGAVVTDASWYRALNTPSWAPPGWVFGPVWITLYTMMGVAAWLVWRTPAGAARTTALVWFGVQLALNAAWTPVFFGLRSLGGGLVVILMLLVAIVATIVAFRRRSPGASWLFAPYLAWVSFATALNGAIWLRS
jgi:translocator protein